MEITFQISYTDKDIAELLFPFLFSLMKITESITQPLGFQNLSNLLIHWKDWCWSWNSSALATWCKQLTHLKRSWCWERLKAGGEGDDRRWDGWKAPLTQWTWVSISSRSWWWTGKPGVLQSMGLQRVGDDSEWTELNWISLLL